MDTPAQPTEKKGLTHQTIKGLFWTSSGTGIQSALQILVTVTLARLLTPREFGLASAAGIAVGFCRLFTTIGINPALVQRAHIGKRHIRTGFTLSVLLALAFTAGLYLLAPLLSLLFKLDITALLQLLSIGFIIRALATVPNSLLTRQLRFKTLAAINLFSFIFGSGLVTIILAWYGAGVWALVIGQLADNTFTTVALLIACPHTMRPSINKRATQDLVFPGTRFSIARIGNYLALQGDYFVSGRWLGASALGLYSRAYNLMAVPGTLYSNIVDSVLFPTMSRVQDQKERMRTAFRRGMFLISWLTIPTSAIILVLSKEIVYVLLGAKWKGVIIPLQLLALGSFFRIGYQTSGTVLRSKGALNRYVVLQVLYAGLVFAGALLGKSHGIAGIALAVTCVLALHFSLMSILTMKTLQLSWKEFLGATLPGCYLGALAFALSFVLVTLLRQAAMPAWGILPVVMIIVMCAVAVLVWMLPSSLVATDGLWWLQLGEKYIRLPAFHKMNQRLAARIRPNAAGETTMNRES